MSRFGETDFNLAAAGPQAAGGGQPLQRILVPVDPFGRANRALALAAQFSAAVGGQLRLVHVRTWEPAGRNGAGHFFFQTSEEATTVLDKALTSVWASGVPASGVVVEAARSRAARAIAAEARSWGAGVMVVARRQRTALGVLVFGSLSAQLMREASCPVLVMHQRER
jgi:nucleotide-binding universal stress UspA family protein